MAKRRARKIRAPIMLFWSKQDQRRFIDAVERFQSCVNDLTVVADGMKRRRPRKPAASGNENNGQGG